MKERFHARLSHKDQQQQRMLNNLLIQMLMSCDPSEEERPQEKMMNIMIQMMIIQMIKELTCSRITRNQEDDKGKEKPER
jgi:hypothetical protein